MGCGIDQLAEQDYSNYFGDDEEEIDETPHGYKVTTTVVTKNVRYVKYADNDERWENVYRDSERYDPNEIATVEVERCEHPWTSGNNEPLVDGGLVSLSRSYCDLCGEHLDPEVQHDTYYKVGRPFWRGDPEDGYMLDTFGWRDESELAHI